MIDKSIIEKQKIKYKLIYDVLIFLSISMIVVAGFYILNEIMTAKKSCKDLGGNYIFHFPNKHLCNNKSFFKYSDGWDFSREINLSNIIIP